MNTPDTDNKIIELFNYSEWQEIDNPPSIIGVYQVELKGWIDRYPPHGLKPMRYSYWNGEYFCVFTSSMFILDRRIKSPSIYQNNPSDYMYRGVI